MKKPAAQLDAEIAAALAPATGHARAPSDIEQALAHAERFVEILHAHGIASNAWGKPGVGIRVYIGRQHVGIDRGGTVHAAQRGRSTFLEAHLYPDERARYRAALAAYRDQLERFHQEQFRAREHMP